MIETCRTKEILRQSGRPACAKAWCAHHALASDIEINNNIARSKRKDDDHND